jgi:hypothetical protein
MTEAEWLTAQSTDELLDYLRSTLGVNRKKTGRRKLRLFACACCRRGWNLFHGYPDYAALVDAAEQFADAELPNAALQRLDQSLQVMATYSAAQCLMVAAKATASTDVRYAVLAAAVFCAQAQAFDAPDYPGQVKFHQSQDAVVFRCVFGNPFRPVAFEPEWRTSDVVALARGIYDARAFDRMPILADALQDAGCDNDDILTHCRDTGSPHARGCWVVDRVLGKLMRKGR